MSAADERHPQVEAAVAVLRDVLADALVSVALYGSAVAGGLRPDSDLDMLVLTARRLDAQEKRRLVDRLLPISGRASRPDAGRPLEVTVVALPEVQPWRYPPRMELQYGEWLRDELERGDPAPWKDPNPDLAMIMSMVRAEGRPLLGPSPAETLEAVPRPDVVRGMLDELTPLLDDIEDDTRNVLLTLGRMWCTVATGEFRSKDAAANWALDQLPASHRPMLARARDLYLGGGHGPWDEDADAVRALAGRLVEEIRAAAG